VVKDAGAFAATHNMKLRKLRLGCCVLTFWAENWKQQQEWRNVVSVVTVLFCTVHVWQLRGASWDFHAIRDGSSQAAGV
jgi:hypothetical protein